MRETLKKLTDASPETSGRTVTLCLQNQIIHLSGIWAWDVNSANIYACDVMFFPADFEGTKGIIHPDDLTKLTASVASLEAKELSHIEFRIITTYGEVKWIKGNRITISSNITEEPEQLSVREPWQEVLEQIAIQKELDFLTLQRELAEYTERLHGIGSWIMNKGTAKAWYSDNMFRIHGLAPQSLNPHLNTFIAFTHPDDRQAVLESFEKAYEEELPLAIEYRIRLRSNEIRYVQQITRWIFNHKGEIMLCGVVRDVTDERLLLNQVQSAQSQSLFSREVLKQFQQHSSAGYWYINLFTKKASYSENFYRIYGIRQVNIPVVNSFFHLVHVDDRKSVEESFESMYVKKVMPEMEFRIVRPDGKLRYLKQSAAPFTSADKDEWMIGVVQDITLQKNLEKKIGELSETAALHQLINSITEQTLEVSIISWLPAGAMRWSDGFYRLTGIKPGTQVSQKLLYGIIHPADIKAFKKAEAIALSNEPVDPFDVRLISKNTIKNLRIVFRFLSDRQTLVAVVQDVTAQTLLLQQQQHNTGFAAILEDAVHDIIIFTNTDNIIIHWNSNAVDKTGITKEDALYNNLFEVLPALHQESFRLKLSRALGGESITESGAENIYLARAQHYTLLPLQNEEGLVTGVLHVVHDVSKQLEMQQQLNERLGFIESLLEASVDQIVVLDRFMNYLYWNKKAEEYYGIAKEKVIGKNILEVFPTFRNHPGYAEFRKVLGGETVHQPAEINGQDADYTETYLTPIKDQHGQVTAVLWIVHDLSREYELQREKQIAEEKLKEQAHYLQRITETTPDMISIMELESKKFTFLNADTFKAHGFDAAEMSKSPHEQNALMVHPDDRVLLNNYFGKLSSAASDDEIISVEYRARTKEEEWKWFLVRGKVFQRDKNQKPTHVLNVIENITEKKNAEQEIIRVKEELARKATDKYEALFNSLDSGFCIIEVLFDENEKPFDYRFLEANKAFEKQTGLVNVAGKTIKELVPEHEQYWFEFSGRIAKSGKPERFENEAKALGHYYEVSAFSVDAPGENHVAVLFNDITERKKEERRQAYLIRLTDALRSVSNPVAVEETVTREAMNYFNADRCYYCEIEGDEAIVHRDAFRGDLPSVSGIYPLSSFAVLKAVIERGKPFVVHDVHTTDLVDEAMREICVGLQVISFVDIPVIKNGKAIGVFCLVQSYPRRWRENEVQLAEETAERTWAAVERARTEEGLRKSELQLSAAFKASPVGLAFIDTKGAMVFSNDEMRRFLPNNIIPSKDETRYLRWVGYDEDGKIVERNNFPTIRALRGETVVPGIVMLYTNDADQKIWTRVSSVPIKDGYGNVVGAISCVTDINEIKKAEEALNQSASKYLNELENQVQQRTGEMKKQLNLLRYTEYLAQSGTWEYEIQSGDFKWSEGMYKLFALPLQMKVLPETYLQFAHEEDRSVAKKIINHFKKNHDPFEEVMRINRNGDVRTLKIKASVIHDENGNAQKIIGVDVDITEVRKAEEKLKDTEHWLEQTTKASPDAITIYDVQQKQPVYLNNCLAEWIGVCNDELIEMGVDRRLELIHPDDRLKLLQFNSKVVEDKNGGISTVEYRVNTINGQTIWLRNRAKIFRRDNQGNATHLLSILQNVTGEVELRNELKRRINFVETLLDSSINRMTVFDRDYKFIVWNKQCEEIFGVTRDKVLGKTIFEMFPGFEKNPVFTDAHERSLSGQYVHVPWVYDEHTGTYLELFYIPLKNEGGDTYAVLNIMHDVTRYIENTKALNELNTELEIKNLQLEQKNEEITSFAFIASHDMKEPLRKINTFSDWLMEEEQEHLSEKGKVMIEKISKSVSRMEVLIEDVLILTKIHSDPNQEDVVDLHLVLKLALEDMAEQISITQTTVDFGELPVVKGNHNQVFYLFKNLLSNAIKFQKPGNAPHITVSAETVKGEETRFLNPHESYARISFTDNGFGFDQRYAKKIFQVFQRLHGKSEYEGTGIGLAICKKIMENHKGAIDVKSEPGKGSVFNCFFPLH